MTNLSPLSSALVLVVVLYLGITTGWPWWMVLLLLMSVVFLFVTLTTGSHEGSVAATRVMEAKAALLRAKAGYWEAKAMRERRKP